MKNFNSENEKHVMWLKKLHDSAKNISEGKLADVLKQNPFDAKINPTDIPELHFTLSTKYTGAVFAKKAWIP